MDAAPEAVDVEVKVHEAPSLETRKSWVEDTLLATADGRSLSAKCERYYYGKQWTPYERKELNKRGQPTITDNLIRRKVNSVRGEEIDKRVDPVARPRTPKHEEEAKAITDALRYVEEDQDIDGICGDITLHLMWAASGAIVEVDDQDGYRCLVSHIPWTQLVVDHRARRRDASDAKHISNVQWFDLDDAIALYPDAEKQLRDGCEKNIGADDETTEDRPKVWYDTKRKRVKVCEMYYRSGGDWYRSDFTDGADLRECAPSPYLDPRNGRPWCPIVVGRVYVDDENSDQGPVHDMLSPQDMVNKTKSKITHLLNVKQVLSEDGVVPDKEELHGALSRPDGGYHDLAPGSLRDGSIEVISNPEISAGNLQMLQEAKQAIDNIGPAAANMPDLPQGASGRSFAFRTKAASREIGPIFEVIRSIRLRVYEHVWGCLRQFATDEMWLRITDDEATAGYRWVALNRKMTRGERLQELLEKGQPLPVALENAAGDDARSVLMRVQQMHQAMAQQAIAFGQPPPGGPEHMIGMVLQDPVMQEQIVENQVGEAMMDITIHEAPESAVLADEQFAKLSDLAGAVLPGRPDLVETFTEMLVELSEFRDKRKVLEKMRQPPDPQKAQMQQMQQQMAMAGAKAGIDVQASQAILNQARARSEMAKTQQAGAKLPSEVQKNEAQAMQAAASAGEKMGPVLPGVM